MRSPLKVRLSLYGVKQPDNQKEELDQLAEEDAAQLWVQLGQW
jgi:hypothetical protein